MVAVIVAFAIAGGMVEAGKTIAAMQTFEDATAPFEPVLSTVLIAACVGTGLLAYFIPEKQKP